MSKKIKFEGYSELTKTLDFRLGEGEYLYVTSFNNGIMVVEPCSGEDLYAFAKKIASCFKKKSEFYGLKAIKFEFNEVHVIVTEKNANAKEIVKMWDENCYQIRK